MFIVTRGYGKPSDRESGSDDEEMSDDGPDDTLNNSSRDKNSELGHQRLEFVMGDHILPRDMTVSKAQARTKIFGLNNVVGLSSCSAVWKWGWLQLHR